jgi:nitrite reductase/ring-hydroxylating ferredoxin subunit
LYYEPRLKPKTVDNLRVSIRCHCDAIPFTYDQGRSLEAPRRKPNLRIGHRQGLWQENTANVA